MAEVAYEALRVTALAIVALIAGHTLATHDRRPKMLLLAVILMALGVLFASEARDTDFSDTSSRYILHTKEAR